MEFVEQYFIILAALFVVAGIVMVALYSSREVILHKRKAINYENYMVYRGYFTFEPHKALVIPGIVYLALIIVVSFLILRNEVLKIYLFIFGAMTVWVGTSLVLYYFSKGYNRDLSEFDSIHESISNSFINKQKLLDFIRVLKARRDEIRSDVTKIHDTCDTLVLNYKGIDGLEEIDKPLSDIIVAQESIANSFDNTMTSFFTTSLIDYLKSGSISAHTYNLFNPITGIELEKICTEIHEEKIRLLSAYIVHVFEKAQFKDNQALIRVADMLRNHGLFKDAKYTQVILEYIATHEANRDEVVNYLYHNNLVNYQVLLRCEDKGYIFLFDRSVNRYVSEKEMIEFITIIIKKDNYKLANKYLVFCTKADCEGIRTALDLAAVSNKTSELFEGYYHLLQLDSGYNDVSTRYESIALTLRNYYAKDKTSLDCVNRIIEQESYLENQVQLDAMYNRALAGLQPVLD